MRKREDKKKKAAAEGQEEEIDNIIVFPGSEEQQRRDINDLLPKGWHLVHVKLAPHISHIIIFGAATIILVGASIYGIHEGLVHHLAVAIIAERMATLGLSSKG